MNQIKDYAEALKARLEVALGMNPLRVSYTGIGPDGHFFSIREGSRSLPNYYGERILTGKHSGYGVIRVYKKPNLEAIKRAVEEVNGATSLDFAVNAYSGRNTS